MSNLVINEMSREFMLAKQKNPSYSLRAFADRLDIPVSALSEILSGKRGLTRKMSLRVIKGLGLNPLEFSEENIKNVELIDLDYFKVISDWYYFAILSLAEIDGFLAEPNWVAKRLNISKSQAKVALERLLKLNLLKLKKNGQVVATGNQLKTPTEIVNISLKNHTSQSLDLAKESLFRDPIDLRDFSTITMSIDTDKISEAKKMIKMFRKRLSKKLETNRKKEVYKLAIQLFPLTRRGND